MKLGGSKTGTAEDMWTVLTNTLKEQVVCGHGVRFEPQGFVDENGMFHLQSVNVFLEEAESKTE